MGDLLIAGRPFIFSTLPKAAYHHGSAVYIINNLVVGYHPLQWSGISSILQEWHIIRVSGIYSFRCKAPLCFALRALLGFSERTEEQSALARLCKHRLCCWIILLSAQHPRVGCVAPLLGMTERAEEQSALARLCKHRLSSLDYHPFQRNGISSFRKECISSTVGGISSASPKRYIINNPVVVYYPPSVTARL